MAIQVNGQTKRIGLALSGGGFRAAGFHLGVFRALEQMKLLDKIDVLSCVSGGSVAGAFLSLNWGKADTLSRLDAYLASKSIAVSSFITGLLDPFETRLEKLADTYDRDLIGGAPLKALKGSPRTYLNATNLVTGNMFSFVAGGGGDTEMGEHELGFCDASEFRMALAVAASSAFPPVFPPLKLTPEQYPNAGAADYVTLTDGGVYDNMGVAPLLNKRNALDYVIVSDGGKPFANSLQPTTAGEMVLAASIDIMMEQIRGLEFDRMEYRGMAPAGPKAAWFSIDSMEGEERPGDAAFASSISTNLKKLTVQERDVLSRHGAALTRARIKKWLPELVTG